MKFFHSIIKRFSQVNIKQTQQPAIKAAKQNQQAKQLFQSLLLQATPEGIAQEYLQQNFKPQEIYERIDSSFEAFFSQRPLDLENMNFYLLVLTRQNKIEQSIEFLDKMKSLNVEPDSQSYNYIIRAFGSISNIDQALKYFDEALLRFGPNKYLYTTMINCYTKNNNIQMSKKLFIEMQGKGLQPDIVCITSMIRAYAKVKNYKEAWNLHYQVRLDTSLFGKPDEAFYGVMLEICAATHEAEKAYNFYHQMEDLQFREQTMVYNSLIKALGSRPDYAMQGIDYFNKMIVDDIPIDHQTILSVLRACSTIGDVKTANTALLLMKEKKLILTAYHIPLLLKTYTSAVTHENQETDIKQMYIDDAWELIKLCEEKKWISTPILNELIRLEGKGRGISQIEGLVLPMYDKYKLKYDTYTYQNMIECLNDIRDISKVFKVFDTSKQEKIKPSFWMLSNYLECGIRALDSQRILEALLLFKKIDREPRNYHLKKLGNSKQLPDEILSVLGTFQNKFGNIKQLKEL